MRKSKFSETPIVAMLKEAESGVPVADLTQKTGVSKATFFKWRPGQLCRVGGRTRRRDQERDLPRPSHARRRFSLAKNKCF
jgi:putative transposase